MSICFCKTQKYAQKIYTKSNISSNPNKKEKIYVTLLFEAVRQTIKTHCPQHKCRPKPKATQNLNSGHIFFDKLEMDSFERGRYKRTASGITALAHLLGVLAILLLLVWLLHFREGIHYDSGNPDRVFNVNQSLLS